MTEPKKNTALTVILKQAQTIMAFVYLIMVGVGMLYYYQKYSEFDINIFQYADIFYFLVAPFEDIFIFLLCAIAVTLFSFIYVADGMIREKAPRLYTALYFGMNKVGWYQKSQGFIWAITFISVLFVYSLIYGNRAKEIVLESEPITIAFSDNQKLVGQMIGKTDSTLFLLQGSQVKAIPINSEIKEIVITTSFDPDPDPEPEADAE